VIKLLAMRHRRRNRW